MKKFPKGNGKMSKGLNKLASAVISEGSEGGGGLFGSYKK